MALRRGVVGARSGASVGATLPERAPRRDGPVALRFVGEADRHDGDAARERDDPAQGGARFAVLGGTGERAATEAVAPVREAFTRRAGRLGERGLAAGESLFGRRGRFGERI